MTELIPSLCNDCISRNQCGKDDITMCASYTKEIKIRCDDCKFVENCVDYGWQECKKFTPKPREPMTNEEYIRQASTEELAKFFQKITDRCFACGVKNADGISNEPCKERFCSRLVFEWLKEIHNEMQIE